MHEKHWISPTCKGEKCSICGEEATHKIGEEISNDDPRGYLHPFTTYVCCGCFRNIFGPAVFCERKLFEKLTKRGYQLSIVLYVMQNPGCSKTDVAHYINSIKKNKYKSGYVGSNGSFAINNCIQKGQIVTTYKNGKHHLYVVPELLADADEVAKLTAAKLQRK